MSQVRYFQPAVILLGLSYYFISVGCHVFMFCHSLSSSLQLLLFKKSILKPKDGKDEQSLEQPPDILNLEIYHYVSKALFYHS